MGLEGRIALVTGGGRGIGRAIAIALAEDGADVAINYRRDEDAALETVAAVQALSRRAGAFRASVDDVGDCTAMVAAIGDELGTVDIFVSNAGIASRGLPVVDTEVAEVERLFRTHTLGAFTLSKLLLPGMRTRPRGDIVMISSGATSVLSANSSPYNMAKAALEALSVTLAKEERAHGVRVNVVAPGLVDTDMGRRLVKATMKMEDIHELDARSPFGRVCTPEDIAGVVRFLVSDYAAYVTGERITVDGRANR